MFYAYIYISISSNMPNYSLENIVIWAESNFYFGHPKNHELLMSIDEIIIIRVHVTVYYYKERPQAISSCPLGPFESILQLSRTLFVEWSNCIILEPISHISYLLISDYLDLALRIHHLDNSSSFIWTVHLKVRVYKRS